MIVLRNFDCSLEFVFSQLLLQPFNFSPVSFACIFQEWGKRLFSWNRFPIKNLLIDSLLTPIVESTYLNWDQWWCYQFGASCAEYFGAPVTHRVC